MPVRINCPDNESGERIERILGDAMQTAGYPRLVTRKPGRGDAAEIWMMVAERRGLTVAEFADPTRKYRISHPRQEAMFLIRHATNQSLPQIGRFFGLHHTTVLHGIREVERRCGEDWVLKLDMLDMQREARAIVRGYPSNVPVFRTRRRKKEAA